MSKLLAALDEKLFVYISIVIFLILLLRNPYSQRTQIPNLEPYPDTFHYLVPARNLASGGGLYIEREGRKFHPSVPPAYSLVLAPFYLISSDVRNFYLANVFLSLISLLLFYQITKKLTENAYQIGLGLLLFTTNYYLYWYPQWAMAENLVLTLFLALAYLLLCKINKKRIMSYSFLTISVIATKYAFFPIAVVFWGSYLFLIIRQKEKVKEKLAVLVASSLVFMSLLLIYMNQTIGFNSFDLVLHLFGAGKVDINYAEMGEFGSSWFSYSHLRKNLPAYVWGIFGEETRFLWEFEPIISKWLAALGIFGLLTGLLLKKTRYISAVLLLILIAQTLFMSMFFVVDMRYLYISIPILLIGVIILLTYQSQVLRISRNLMVLIVIFISTLYLYGNAERVKDQMVLNLKYAEEPWYYKSILSMNDYFKEQNNIKPVVISPMPPYLIDFYSNGDYLLLPLSADQEFRSYRQFAWGDYNYNDMHGLYKAFLDEGHELYVSKYGIGNEQYLHEAFERLSEDFDLKLVKEDCFQQCNIYILTKK